MSFEGVDTVFRVASNELQGPKSHTILQSERAQWLRLSLSLSLSLPLSLSRSPYVLRHRTTLEACALDLNMGVKSSVVLSLLVAWRVRRVHSAPTKPRKCRSRTCPGKTRENGILKY